MEENVDNVNLWGEYEGSNSSKLQFNREALNTTEHEVILNSIKNINPKKYFFNPEGQSNFIPIKKETEYVRLDNTMKDVIKILNYRDVVKTIVEKAALRKDVDQLSEQIRALPVPRLLKEKHDNSNRPPLLIHHDGNFVNGVWDEKPPNITPESALNTLSTSVATILAFTGFSETSNLSLNILTEIAEEYIKKMLRLLKFNVEKEKLRGESGFCDVVDRTFHEMGLGSLKNLITYYQSSIIEYKDKKLIEVKDDIRTCDNTIEKIKEEQRQVNGRSIIVEDDHSAIPELHVTSMLGSDFSSSSFETGLQMLHTIENQKLTDVENNSLNDSIVQIQNEYNDSKSVKRKRR